MGSELDPRESWRRVEQVLDAVLDLPAEARIEAVEQLCGGDQDLSAEVCSLLEATVADDPLLDRPMTASVAELLRELEDGASDEALDLTGHLIGPYRIVRRLGEGGMGVVFLARRADGEFDKEVAIKLVPGALAGSASRDRFVAERQILARLEHPNIARLLDGGVTDDGSPYLVMEYVDGVPIDAFCSQNRLPLIQRLELFRTVCSAVEHAHHNLVIHRDLKPRNILVADDGTVKLLDFGIAKLLDKPGDGLTRSGQAFLTPEFAAPEQFRGEPVTIASDVYSLGVLLFRMLTDRPPFEFEGLSLAEVTRLVLEQPAPRPSDSVGPEVRSGSSRRMLRGDLDTIVAKALRKTPDQRYSTTGELSDDVLHFLEDRPIFARPASWKYRTGKFLRRHTVASAAAALLGLTVLAGFAGITWQGRVAARERDVARAEARKAERVAAFLSELFGAANPFTLDAGQLTARDLLDRGEERIRTELVGDPEVRAELLRTMGLAYNGLGDYDRAIDLVREAAAERRRVGHVDNLDMAHALTSLGMVHYSMGEYDEADRHLREALGIYRQSGGTASHDYGMALRYLALIERDLGNPDRAVDLHQLALTNWRRLGVEAYEAGELSNLAMVYQDQGRADESLRLTEHALEILIRIHGDDHPTVATVRNNVAKDLHNRGDYEEAAALYLRALEISERTLGPEHPGVADHLTNYGKVLLDQGRFLEASSPIRRAARIRRATDDEMSFYRIATEINLATLARELGDLEQAEAGHRSAHDRIRELLGPEHPASARAASLLAQTLQRSGDYKAAEEIYIGALRSQRLGATNSLHQAETTLGLGGVTRELGRLSEAEALLREALELRAQTLPANSWKLAEARVELGACLLSQGRFEEARSLLEPSAMILEATLGQEDSRCQRARVWLSELP